MPSKFIPYVNAFGTDGMTSLAGVTDHPSLPRSEELPGMRGFQC